jgi:hypothetical protein
VNPTAYRISIVSVRLDHDSPANVYIEQGSPPMELAPRLNRSLGRFAVTSARSGVVQTRVIVRYEVEVKGSEMIEIHVVGYVSIGRFDSCVSEIEFERSNPDVYRFFFYSRFHEPAALLAVRVDSPVFDFPTFRPFVMKPGNRSRSIDIRHLMSDQTDSTRDHLVIETNITRFEVPTSHFQGNCLFLDRLPTVRSSGVFYQKPLMRWLCIHHTISHSGTTITTL